MFCSFDLWPPSYGAFSRGARELSSAPWFRSSRRLEAFQLAADLPPTPSKSSLTVGETRHLNLPGPFKNRVRHLRDALPPSGRTSGTRRTRSAARTMPQGAGSEALARLVAAVAKGQKTVPQVRKTIRTNCVLRSLPGTSKAALYRAVARAKHASAAPADSVAEALCRPRCRPVWLLPVVWLWGAVCLFVCLFLRPPTRCPVHHLSHLLLRRFRLQCLPLAACAHFLQRVVLVVALSSIVVGCLPMVSQVAFATIIPPHLSSYSAG